MRKKNKNGLEQLNENTPAKSENSIENIKYIKQLKLQRAILNKLICSDLNLPASDNSIDLERPEVNKSSTNK